MSNVGSLGNLQLNLLPLQAAGFCSLHPGREDASGQALLQIRTVFACNPAWMPISIVQQNATGTELCSLNIVLSGTHHRGLHQADMVHARSGHDGEGQPISKSTGGSCRHKAEHGFDPPQYLLQFIPGVCSCLKEA